MYNTEKTMKTRTTLSLAAASAGLILAATSANAAVIVAENFGGSGTALNATAADTFAAGIATAGGSSSWVAGADFLDNGVVTDDGDNSAAYLNLGSYINDTKGTAAGMFELTMTISETTSEWLSLGFAASNTPSTSQNFTGTSGMGNIIYRADGELDMWAGPGTTFGGVDGPNGNSGPRTLTVTLDLTGHDGVTDFGTVSWSDSVIGDLGSVSYTSDVNFGSILLSESASGGTVSALSLSQIPEPTTTALLGLGGLALIFRRRK
jgi:hypothetical protein